MGDACWGVGVMGEAEGGGLAGGLNHGVMIGDGGIVVVVVVVRWRLKIED